MALRIAGNKKPLPVEEELPVEEVAPEEVPTEEPMPEEVPEEVPEEATPTGGALDPIIAGYKGPEDGPFMCGSCVHFSASGPNTCAIVSGYIDEGGICNVFTPLQEASAEEPAEEPVSEELPVEEAAPLPEEAPIEEAPPV